ncbi:MAG: insulinase family protein [Ferruginibacter sp.]
MKSKNSLILLFAICIFFSQGLEAQTVLPLNPKVKTGKLENGLTYFILPNKKPENKVELRLALNAGAINEDDDQQGLAHMAEHMAFNGTKNFKKNDIISFLQDIGVGFGSDLNAYTSFDETVYILPIPTDKPDNLEKGFQVLEDWAHNVTYNNDDIDGERPIILEESRLGKGANDRMFRKLYPKLFKGSLYADRLPIGVDSIIKGFQYPAIKRFYNDWYRPNLMAVIVVGDITVEKAEALIKKHFAGMKNPDTIKERKYAGVPAYTSSDALVVTDKEATSYQVSVQYPAFVKEDLVTDSNYKNSVIRSLFSTILNQRLQELTQKENPPYLYAYGSFGSYARGFDAFSLNAGAGTNDPSTALTAMMTEVEKAKRFGFTQPELDRAKKSYLNRMEKAYNDRDKTESSSLVDELVRNFLEKEAMPGIEVEYELAKKFSPVITLENINSVLDVIKGDKNKLVAVMGPEGTDKIVLPDSLKLIQTLAAVEKADLKAYEEKAVATNLLSKEPKAGKVLSRTVNVKNGTTELKLSNGVTVTLKKTDFKNDEVIMSAARFGGKNEYGLKDKYNAQYATQIVSTMGFGDFSPVDLRKSLAGKTASAGDIFTDTKDGFSGSSSVKDVETMLQLLYLHVTAPRKDTALFNSFIQKNKSQLAMLGANPQAAFIDTFYKTMYNNNPLAPVAVPHAEFFDQVKLDRAMEIYKAHFGDMSGMQFAFVGNIDEQKIIPLVEKYIGSLPASGKKFTWTDNKVRTAKGKINLDTYKGKEEKSLILVVFAGETPYNEDEALKAEALTEVLNIRIIEELREKVQGIYGGGIYGGLEKVPYSSYSFIAQLPCGPEKVDTLTQALQNEIARIRTNGIEESYLSKVKKQWLEAHKETIKSNSAWAGNIIDSKVGGESMDRFINYEKYVEKLTTADIKKVANTYLSGNNMMLATLMPEKYNPKGESATSTGNRTNVVLKTIDIKSADIKIELYDNGDVDGDEVTVYFNGNVVSSKQKLTEKAITINLKALKNSTNELVMYADNLGTIPPNTALMKVYCEGQVYEVRMESDEKKNGVIRFNLK